MRGHERRPPDRTARPGRLDPRPSTLDPRPSTLAPVWRTAGWNGEEMTTLLAPADYLGALRADGGRLAAVVAAADLDRPVPTCPGWTVRDAVLHTGSVLAHKTAVLACPASRSRGSGRTAPRRAGSRSPGTTSSSPS